MTSFQLKIVLFLWIFIKSIFIIFIVSGYGYFIHSNSCIDKARTGLAVFGIRNVLNYLDVSNVLSILNVKQPPLSKNVEPIKPISVCTHPSPTCYITTRLVF